MSRRAVETPSAPAAEPAAGASRRGGTALLALGSLAAVLCVAELAVRLLLPAPLPLRVAAAAARGEAEGLPDDALYQRDARGVTLRPNAHLLLRDHPLSRRDVEIRTNALGHRGPDLPPKAGADLRILVIGDSITLGDYVAEQETYPAWIERGLRDARAPDAPGRVDVANGGVGSIGIGDIQARLEQGAPGEPDVVVVGLYLNDADASIFLPPIRLPGLLERSHLAHQVADRWRSFAIQAAMDRRLEERAAAAEEFRRTHEDTGFDREVLDAFWDWGYAWSEEGWTRIEDGVRALQRASWRDGYRLVLALHPVRQQVEAEALLDEPQQRFAAMGRRLGIPALDLLPALREARRTDLSLYYDHCHYTPAGNRVVGARIAGFLRDELR